MILPGPALTLMEIAINRALKLDDESLQKVISLQGSVIGIELLELNLRFYLLPNADGIQVLAETSEPIDTWIKGSPINLLKTAVSNDRSSLFQGEVSIEGDMELGQTFQRILKGLEIDWEEPLSKVVGDVTAHQIGDVVRGFSQWAVNSLDSLSKTSGEYFQEESRDIVSPTEVERFVNQVDEVRSDTERLQLRVNKLIQKIEVS